MDSDKSLWVLKQQPEIEMTDERIYFKLPWGSWWTSRKDHESDFVSVESLTTQLHEAIQSVQNATSYLRSDDEKELVEQILELIGITTKDKK
jgi:hypothetical protein